MKLRLPKFKAIFHMLGIAIVLFAWGKITRDYRPFLVYTGFIALAFGIGAANEIVGGLKT